MACSPKLEMNRLGYVVTGTCGTHVVQPVFGRQPVPSTCWAKFGANEIVTRANFSPGVCADFFEKVTAVFGPGGSRRLMSREDAAIAGGYCPPELVPRAAEELYPSRATSIADFCREGLAFKPPKPKG